MKLDHFPERSGPSGLTHGNLQSEAMGRPDLREWDLLVRETLQNSWDARLPKQSCAQMSFSFDFVRLSGEQKETLKKDIFTENELAPAGISAFLKREDSTILVVSDRGTHGLRGPTNSAVECSGPTDYRSFVLEFGREESKELKGGTFGVGKGILFGLSKSRTILIYSRTLDEMGNRVNRFVGVANQGSFEKQQRRFTGRHWWGVLTEFDSPDLNLKTPYVLPVEGVDADLLAAKLGMDRGFTDERQTGTSIAILDPLMAAMKREEVVECSPQELAKILADAITRWAWPHQVCPLENEPEIEFQVTCNGNHIQIRDPMKDSVLKHYARAYRNALQVDIAQPEGLRLKYRTEVSSVRSKSPDRGIGRFGIREVGADVPVQDSILEEGLDRVALLRKPRMVVQYASLGQDALGRQFAGVFIADDSVDYHFAKSEPPSHDSWNLKSKVTSMAGTSGEWKNTNPVRVADTRLRSLIRGWSGDPELVKDRRMSMATQKLANELGGIFNGVVGTSTSRKTVSKSRSKRTRSSSSGSFFTSRVLQIIPFGDRVITVFEISSSQISGKTSVSLTGIPFVLADAKKVQEPEMLISSPVILGYKNAKSPDEKMELMESFSLNNLEEINWLEKPRLTGDKGAVVLAFVQQARGQAVGLSVVKEGV